MRRMNTPSMDERATPGSCEALYAGPAPVDIAVLIDAARIGAWHIGTYLVCLAAMILEGYDTYAVSYVGPQIAAEWHVEPALLGWVFSSAIVGGVLAYFLVGPVADRLGRRIPAIIGAAALGITTLLSTSASGVEGFIAWRLAVGLALGAMLPNVVAIAGEFVPHRRRSVAVVTLYSGFAIGSALAGVLAGPLVASVGWRAVFVAGGIAPLVLAVVMFARLPESPRFLALHEASGPRLRAVLARLTDLSRLPSDASFSLGEVRASGVVIGELFRAGRTVSTVLIWLVLAMDTSAIGGLVFWIPTLVHQAGLPVSAGIHFSVTLVLGGIVGAFAIGACMDRFGIYRVLIPAHLCAVLFIGAFALTVASAPIVIALLIGLTLNGGTSGSQGLLARLYPTALRATGVGWASGVARFISIGQPLITGLMLRANWSPRETLLACSVPALVSVLALAGLARDHYGRAAG
jgi:AAHS family 4-hydroxybenzoate transporter-like MFS transporter